MTTSRARTLVLLAAVFFGTTGTAQALGPDDASPVAVGAARVLVGALGLLLAARVLSPAPSMPPSGAGAGAGARTRPAPRWPALARRPAVLVGGAGVAAYQLGFFAAVQLTGVAVGTVVALGSAPVVTGLLGWAVLGQRPGRRWAAATALAAAGLTLLTLAAGAGGVHPGGVALALVAAVSYAVYTLGTKRLLDDGVPAERAVAAVFAAGAVLLVPALVIVPVAPLLTAPGLLTVLWLGIVPTALAYVLFARGLRVLPAAEVSTLTLAEPLTAAVLGVLLLREGVSPGTAAGALLLLAGLAVLAVQGGRPGRSEAVAAGARA